MAEYRSHIVARTARKRQYCGVCGYRSINPGDRYLSHTLFPSHELSGGVFQRTGECAKHAIMYGRGAELAGAA